MQRGYLIPTYARQEWDAQFSLPANISTAMLLVDYAAHGLTTPTAWPTSIVPYLPTQARTDLDAVRTILAHGAVLREYFLKHIPDDSPAQYEWSALHIWIDGLLTSEIEELINDSIRANLAYYHQYMEPRPEVEQYLEQLGASAPDDEILAHPKQRRIAMQASIVSWGRINYEATLALMEHPERLRATILAFLEELWQQGFSAEWERQKEPLALQVEATRTRFSAELANATPDEVMFRITGRQPSEEWMEPLRHAPHIILVPCIHLGSYLSMTQVEETRYIFYEPFANIARFIPIQSSRNSAIAPSFQILDLESLGPSLEIFGSATSMTILLILSAQGEMIAQQVAEQAAVHQSTISRHFAQLERTGLVLVRRVAGMKYYTVNRQRVKEICQLLFKTFLE
ncbi:MAG: hypothetical protein NVS2B12_40630 [Ktedonobacteraceae bacterium]